MRRALSIPLLLCGLLIGCRGARVPAAEVSFAVTRPAACAQVAAGTDLSQLLRESAPGAALCLQPGVYAGPLLIDRGQTVYGPRDAIVRSSGQGTTVRLLGKGARLAGLTVDGSGARYDKTDAGVHLQGEDLEVVGVRVRGAVFGVVVDRCARALLRGNEIIGTGDSALGLRGDAIRLWESKDSTVEDNVVRSSRDVVIRYTTRTTLRRNRMSGGRYGIHLMYSQGAQIEDNRSVGNVVGLFLMYSREVSVRRNLLAASIGAAGIGLGLKESGDVQVTDNLILRNSIGVYLDTAPLYLDQRNLFQRNAIRLSDVAVTFHSSQRHNRFLANSLRDNHTQVRVEGGGDALGTEWSGNDFDDYAGYDFDHDGFGDVPYELRSLSGELTSRYPELSFFRGTPSLSLLDAMSHIAPLFQLKLMLRDARPSLVQLSASGPQGADPGYGGGPHGG